MYLLRFYRDEILKGFNDLHDSLNNNNTIDQMKSQMNELITSIQELNQKIKLIDQCTCFNNSNNFLYNFSKLTLNLPSIYKSFSIND